MGFQFSVIVPVHFAISEWQLKESLDSVTIDQDLLPSELILVIDGTIESSFFEFINLYKAHSNIPIKIVHTGPVPKGPGFARNMGVNNADFSVVAFMDSDDVSVRSRFRSQVPLLYEGCYDLIGGQISEYDEMLTEVLSIRSVPTNSQDILNTFKFRNPINNVTVVVKKEVFIKLGGYPNLFFGEDYVLWLKFAEGGYRMLNLESVLVKVRTGDEFLSRRFGFDSLVKNLKLSCYLMNFELVGVAYSLLRMMKFFVLLLLPKSWQYHYLKKYTRNLT